MSTDAPKSRTKPDVEATRKADRRFFISIFLLCFLVFFSALISCRLAGRAAADQLLFHEPTIRQFAAQWPHPDLYDYWSATSPGYHILLALYCRYVDSSLHALRNISAWITISLILVLASSCRVFLSVSASSQRQPTRTAFQAIALTLPMLSSIYVWSSGVWLLPDNLGWLTVLFVLMFALAGSLTDQARRPQRLFTRAWYLMSGAFWLAVAIFVRQSNLWVAAPLVAAAYLWPGFLFPRVSHWACFHDRTLSSLFSAFTTRLKAAAWALLACTPAIALLAWLMHLWGGLTPPRFQQQHVAGEVHTLGLNPATPALAFALLAIYSLFLCGFWIKSLLRLWQNQRWLVIAAATFGFFLAVIPDTTYQLQTRMSGIWQLVQAMESRGLVFADHTSPLFVVFAPLGCIILCAWLSAVNSSRRWLMLVALLAFIVAQAANANAWQRYLEPGLLMMLSLLGAMIWNTDDHEQADATGPSLIARTRIDWNRLLGVARWLGVISLSLVLASITIVQTTSAPTIDLEDPPKIPDFIRQGPLPPR